jgi:hypothetical protein
MPAIDRFCDDTLAERSMYFKSILDNVFQGDCVKVGRERHFSSEKTFYATKMLKKRKKSKRNKTRKNMSE